MVSSGAMSPARAPHSMDMFEIVIRPSMESASMTGPRYSTTWPTPPPVPTCAMSARMRSLAVTPGEQLAHDRDRHRPRPGLREGLRGEDVLDLAGADAEGERTEGAVGRGVRVAADDRHAGLGDAQLRADDVHDALLDVAERVQPDPELGAVAPQRLDLRARDRVGDGQQVVGRRVVVLGGQREIGPAHRPPGQAQAVERLRAGHLMDEVQVDIEQIRLAVGLAHDVCVPHLFGQGPCAPDLGCSWLPPSGHPTIWEVCFMPWDTV